MNFEECDQQDPKMAFFHHHFLNQCRRRLHRLLYRLLHCLLRLGQQGYHYCHSIFVVVEEDHCCCWSVRFSIIWKRQLVWVEIRCSIIQIEHKIEWITSLSYHSFRYHIEWIRLIEWFVSVWNLETKFQKSFETKDWSKILEIHWKSGGVCNE